MQTGSTCEHAFTDDSAHVLHDHGYNQTAVISTGIPNSRNSEDKESNDDIHWQTVTGSFKRPRKLVSNGPDISKKLCSSPSSFSLTTNNRFDAIGGSNTMDESTTSTPPSHVGEDKPPPIFVPNVVNVKSMITAIETVIPNDNYTFKCLSQNKFKVNTTNIDGYGSWCTN
ncbi:hypothetical protein J6590_044948 [Homalodisca vitripennis]|nr:hypothetical protein J6590_044948 [Homalodisca vitripennis]